MRELSRRPFDLDARPAAARVADPARRRRPRAPARVAPRLVRRVVAQHPDARAVGALRRASQRRASRHSRRSRVQYGDFARWQRDTLQGAALERHVAFWREQLRDAPALLELPTDRPRPATPSFEGATRSRMLPAALLERLRALSKANGTHAVRHAARRVRRPARAATADRTTSSSARRPRAARTRAPKGSSATSPTRSCCARGSTTTRRFVDLLRARARDDARARSSTRTSRTRSSSSSSSAIARSGRGGLFQVMFTLQDAELRTMQLPGLGVRAVRRGARRDEVRPLAVHARAGGRSARGVRVPHRPVRRRDDRPDARAASRCCSRGSSRDPTRRSRRCRSCPRTSDTLLEQWSDGAAQRLEAETLHEMIAQQVARTPDAIAVESRRRPARSSGSPSASSTTRADDPRALSRRARASARTSASASASTARRSSSSRCSAC